MRQETIHTRSEGSQLLSATAAQSTATFVHLLYECKLHTAGLIS
jgi:hypothetical protein